MRQAVLLPLTVVALTGFIGKTGIYPSAAPTPRAVLAACVESGRRP